MLIVTTVASCVVWLLFGVIAGYFFSRRFQKYERKADESFSTPSVPHQPLGKKRKERRARLVAAPGGSGQPMPSANELDELRLKMVLIVRRDSNLTSGETAAQASEAAVAVLAKTLYGTRSIPEWIDWYNWWSVVGVAKITLRCPDEQAFNEIVASAQNLKLPYSVVASNAVVALGPAPSEKLDPITGSLKLLS